MSDDEDDESQNSRGPILTQIQAPPRADPMQPTRPQPTHEDPHPFQNHDNCNVPDGTLQASPRTAPSASDVQGPTSIAADDVTPAVSPCVTSPVVTDTHRIWWLDETQCTDVYEQLSPKFVAVCVQVFTLPDTPIDVKFQRQAASVLLWIHLQPELKWKEYLLVLKTGMDRDLWSGPIRSNGLYDTLHEAMTRASDASSMAVASDARLLLQQQIEYRSDCHTEDVRVGDLGGEDRMHDRRGGEMVMTDCTARNAVTAEIARVDEVKKLNDIARTMRFEKVDKSGIHRFDFIVALPSLKGPLCSPGDLGKLTEGLDKNIESGLRDILPDSIRMPEVGMKYVRRWCANGLAVLHAALARRDRDISVGGSNAGDILYAVRKELFPDAEDTTPPDELDNGLVIFLHMKLNVGDMCVKGWDLVGTRIGYTDAEKGSIVMYQRTVSDASAGTGVVSPRALLNLLNGRAGDVSEQAIKLTVWSKCGLLGDDCVVPVDKKSARAMTVTVAVKRDQLVWSSNEIQAAVKDVADLGVVADTTSALINAATNLSTSMGKASEHPRGEQYELGGDPANQSSRRDGGDSHKHQSGGRKGKSNYATGFLDLHAGVDSGRDRERESRDHRRDRQRHGDGKHQRRRIDRAHSDSADSEDERFIHDGGGEPDSYSDDQSLSDHREEFDESDEESEGKYTDDDEIEEIDSFDDGKGGRKRDREGRPVSGTRKRDRRGDRDNRDRRDRRDRHDSRDRYDSRDRRDRRDRPTKNHNDDHRKDRRRNDGHTRGTPVKSDPDVRVPVFERNDDPFRGDAL